MSPKRSDDELRHLSEELSQADTEVLAPRPVGVEAVFGAVWLQAVLQDNLEEALWRPRLRGVGLRSSPRRTW